MKANAKLPADVLIRAVWYRDARAQVSVGVFDGEGGRIEGVMFDVAAFRDVLGDPGITRKLADAVAQVLTESQPALF